MTPVMCSSCRCQQANHPNVNPFFDVCAGSQDGSHGAKARSTRQYASAHPEVTVYTGPQSPRKAVTLRTLRAKYEKGQPITMVTAYDYPSAVHVGRETGGIEKEWPAVCRSFMAVGQASSAFILHSHAQTYSCL
jgi:hypothetical protein